MKCPDCGETHGRDEENKKLRDLLIDVAKDLNWMATKAVYAPTLKLEASKVLKKITSKFITVIKL